MVNWYRLTIATALLLAVGTTATLRGQPLLTTLRGAGATFPSPIYDKWFANFHTKNPNVHITYDAVGSETGIRNLLGGTVDFGASDSSEIMRELDPDSKDTYLLFPSVVGAVVPIVNLPGLVKDLSFTPQALAGIFLGTIRKWNDPVLRHANPGVALPGLDIVVVHRAEGSGTSYALTDYLSQVSPEWKTHVGLGLAPRWPVGQAATGAEGVAQLVKKLDGSIGYVEFIYALRNHMSYGRIQNQSGVSIAADLQSIAAAASSSVALSSDFKGSIVNAPGKGAYPIVTFTWFVVPSHIAEEAKRNALIEFLKWMLGPGQRQAATLGYAALPASIVTREESALTRIR